MLTEPQATKRRNGFITTARRKSWRKQTFWASMVSKHPPTLASLDAAVRTYPPWRADTAGYPTAWVDSGGITGRGVLLDYASFAEKRGIKVDPFESTSIPFSHLEELVRDQGVSFRAGDILFLRVGFTAGYDALSAEQQKALPERAAPDFLGVEPSAATLRWLWESGFAAVASDTPSFEQAPVAGPHTETGGVWKGEPWEEVLQGGGLLHQTLLGGWGMPIGEMFDLETLARTCKELGRWTFFVTSVPLKVC